MDRCLNRLAGGSSQYCQPGAKPPQTEEAKTEEAKTKEAKSEDDKPAKVKEHTAVEHSITGVKNAMSSMTSLLSSITGSKATAESTEAFNIAAPSTSPVPPQAESGISKLSFIPKPTGSTPQSAVVPPSSQVPPSTSFVDSMLGCLSPSRLE